jgi:MoxR-like ATPase
MEESQVTVGGHTYPLPAPFVTIATQNPVEYEGTYPLPEAQLDRFLFKLLIDYPLLEQEYEILARHHRGLNPHDVASAGVAPVASPADILAARALVKQVEVDDAVLRYIVDICRATRTSPSVVVGVSPRGAAALLHATKAWTWMVGRPFATPDEVKAIVYPALRHRLLLRPELELDGLTTDGVLDTILASVPAPR